MLIGQFEGAFQSALADADAFARAKVSVANPEVPDIVCVDIDRADAEVFRNFKKSRSTLLSTRVAAGSSQSLRQATKS